MALDHLEKNLEIPDNESGAESGSELVQEILNKALHKHVGGTIRQLRLQHGLTIAEVSLRAGISRGMMSKIENGIASPSLETLEQLANSLGIAVSQLFRDYNAPRGIAQLVKKDKGMEVVRRGTRSGHTYQLLAYDHGPQKTFEPFLITLEEPDEQFHTFEHPGTEFIYMLEGLLEYRVGDETFALEPGDSLTLRGEIPHRSEKLTNTPIRFISIIDYDAALSEYEAE